MNFGIRVSATGFSLCSGPGRARGPPPLAAQPGYRHSNHSENLRPTNFFV